MTRNETEINLFRAIEVFMAVAEMRHVTAAAHALGITQSAASQHLKNLESAFGVTLIDRSHRPLGLTHAGEAMQRHGYRILNEIEDLKSDLRHLKAASLPVLRVGLLASIATTLTPGLFDFVEHDLQVPELILSAGLASDHQSALTARKIDVAVTSELFVLSDDYDTYPVMEEPFFLVLPEGYDGPEDDIHAISERLSLVRFGALTPVGRRTDQHLQRCRLNLPRAMEADRSSMVVAGVVTGKCFAILTPSLLIDGVAEGMPLRIVPLPFSGFKRGVQVVSRKEDLGDIPARLAHQCADILRAHFNRRFPGIADQIAYFTGTYPNH
ncbi:LysR family transcriptional regulator [Ruegeria arenilitoris]|uniref:LysR family transcriptional regulator n=1 Tax=Ruegeria arenilitoris TaxID=1173585 RepID=UPI00147FFDFF|nr:LysR family transcriptional regulator [Ruegeria arenilitoris]